MHIRYPFLFIGAGEATNFEWCYFFIKFSRIPDAIAIDVISKASPKPIKVYPENVMGTMLHVGSSPYVNQEIERCYGKSIIPSNEKHEYYSYEESRRGFELDIERWLSIVHSVCPIDLALRPEDDEAEGTRLSDWHAWSLSRMNPLIEKWSAEYSQMQAKGERSFFKQMIEELDRYCPTEAEPFSDLFEWGQT